MALAMADADSVYIEEVQRADLMHGSRLEHVLRSGQAQARREIEVSIDAGCVRSSGTLCGGECA